MAPVTISGTFPINFQMPKVRFTEDESLLALELYMTIPRKDIRRDNPEIVDLSRFLTSAGYARSPGSIKAKIENFKAFDPMYPGVSLGHTANIDRVVWENHFATGFTELAEAAEMARERLSQGIPTADNGTVEMPAIGGKTSIREVKVRVNQNIFRARVLTAYDFRCCITGMQTPGLIEACHIKDWKRCPEDSPDRLDPRNGLCMDILHHRSFDKGMFTIDENYKVELSPSLSEKEDRDVLEKFYWPYEGKVIAPVVEAYRPSQEFLDWHRKNVFVEG